MNTPAGPRQHGPSPDRPEVRMQLLADDPGLSADQAEMPAALGGLEHDARGGADEPHHARSEHEQSAGERRMRSTRLADPPATADERQRRQPDDQQEEKRAHADGDRRVLQPAGDAEGDLGARAGAGSADQPATRPGRARRRARSRSRTRSRRCGRRPRPPGRWLCRCPSGGPASGGRRSGSPSAGVEGVARVDPFPRESKTRTAPKLPSTDSSKRNETTRRLRVHGGVAGRAGSLQLGVSERRRGRAAERRRHRGSATTSARDLTRPPSPVGAGPRRSGVAPPPAPDQGHGPDAEQGHPDQRSDRRDREAALAAHPVQRAVDLPLLRADAEGIW